MPFFEVPQEDTNLCDIDFASNLSEIIKKSNKYAKRISIKQWASHFLKLRTVDKIGKDRINKVLDWYKINISKPYTPQALSGKAFRLKFAQLEQAMKRNSSDPSQVVVSPETKKLAEECRQIFSWPKGSGEDLPNLIQLSINNYRPFYEAGRSWIVDYTDKHGGECFDWPLETRRLMAYVQLFFGNPNNCFIGILSSTNSFIKKWLGLVSSKVQNWKEWDGNLNFFIFRLDHPMFLRILREAAADYSGGQDEISWKRVLTLTQEKMK